MRQPDIFQTPPLNETLSHSNGKVVFDHGPKKVLKSTQFHHEKMFPVKKELNCVVYKYEN